MKSIIQTNQNGATAALVLAFLLATGFTVLIAYQAGAMVLHDDTSEPCLGPSDPFCNDGGSDGAGGGSGSSGEDCVKCVFESASSYRCVQTSEQKKGNRCENTVDDNGIIECTVKGSC